LALAGGEQGGVHASLQTWIEEGDCRPKATELSRDPPVTVAVTEAVTGRMMWLAPLSAGAALTDRRFGPPVVMGLARGPPCRERKRACGSIGGARKADARR
jgi:hypothetical protein